MLPSDADGFAFDIVRKRMQYCYSSDFDLQAGKYDMAFSQQNVNYWFDDIALDILCKLLVPGGKFVFNTFNTKPGIIPVTKSYSIGDDHYCETHCMIGDIVYHSQYCSGEKPHHTKFKWITREQFRKLLEKYFGNVSLHTEKNTDIYVATK